MEPTKELVDPEIESLPEQEDDDTLPFEGPVSPIKAIRDSIPVGLRQLAKELNCSYGMIYLAERGCYASIPPVLRDWIIQTGVCTNGLTIAMIDELYSLYIRETRDLFGETYKFHTLLPLEIDFRRGPVGLSDTDVGSFSRETVEKPQGPPINALIRYTNLSKTAFYKGLCVQPANIYKLQTAQARSLPGQIVQALFHAHTPPPVVSYLDQQTKQYYVSQKSKSNGHG